MFGTTRAALAARGLLLLLVLLASSACGTGSDSARIVAVSPTGAPDQQDWFVDQAADTGLNARHANGMSGAFLFPEIMGAGVALFDYDNDGDLDVYVVQGAALGPGATARHTATGGEDTPPGDRLFRNDLSIDASGHRTLHFVDVTRQSGLLTPSSLAGGNSVGYSMGVAAGDADNDGCVDLYITRYGRNSFLHNRCDGTFADDTVSRGLAHEGWSVSAAFVDIDRDGWLDLYVTDYVTYRLEAHTNCVTPSGKPDYCSPSAFRPRPGRLFHNTGHGTFTDVTQPSKVGSAFGPGLGVVSADFNGDGWQDLYIANDGQENQLWINQHDGTFTNTALLAGVALNGSGRAEASMGVDAGDVDGDGDEDLFITNLTGEGHTLYLNDGTGVFEDAGTRSGLRHASLPYTGFGTSFLDADNDGHLDLLTVSGAVRMIERLEQADDRYPFSQRPQLFQGQGTGRFADATARAGTAFQEAAVGRGAAFGDIDNDGDTDVVVANNNGPVRLLINTRGNQQGWLGLRLVGRDGRRDMLGARVAATRRDGSLLWRRAHADGSYGSANDPRVLIGLGGGAAVNIRVRWPGGRSEEWPAPPAERYTTLTEGTGQDTARGAGQGTAR